MAFEKQDSFSQKRTTNIDGFVTRPPQRPTRPVHQPAFRRSAVNPQVPPAMLPDMPRRSQPQSVLSSASMVSGGTAVAQPGVGVGYPPQEGEPRRRRRPEDAVPEEGKRKRRWGRKSRKEKRNIPRWRRIVKRSALVLGVLVLLGGAWFGFRFYKDISKITGNKNPLALLSAFSPVPLKSQNGRVNILIAGNSADDVGHGGADLTDSIMVLSVDTNNNTALMLSIPRDLWVNIPGLGYSKINAAITAGGMNKLQTVVQNVTGVTIDYQVLVNYGAFKDLVNAVGGISIDIQSTDPRGIYDPSLDYQSKTCCALAKYPNGWVTLNGQQALDLARARGDPSPYGIPYGFADGDFDRTEHQRQMAIAIKDKASQASVIANPFKVADLFDAVGNNVATNLKIDEIETLYTYMKKINDNDIASYNVNTLKGGNTTMLANYTSPDGESALIPAAGLDDFSDIDAQIQKIMSDNPVAREGAMIEVLNGTNTTGLAATQTTKLENQGMTVSVADAPATQGANTIIDNSQGKMPNTLAYLKKQYSATVVTSNTLTTTYPNADFILILGQSSVPSTNSTTSSSGGSNPLQ
jgi:polyisoprenyl-teichoic acid--peptidoglycan teichoic acid transferase